LFLRERRAHAEPEKKKQEVVSLLTIEDKNVPEYLGEGGEENWSI